MLFSFSDIHIHLPFHTIGDWLTSSSTLFTRAVTLGGIDIRPVFPISPKANWNIIEMLLTTNQYSSYIHVIKHISNVLTATDFCGS